MIRTIVPGLGAGWGVAVDRFGDCWVTFRQTNRVVKYNRATGNADVTITTANQPVSVAVNNANDIYVTSATVPGQVTYYSSIGQVATSVNAPQQLLGVALDGNGDVWATGQTGGLYKYDRHQQE